jgi:hypothetical protein
MGGMRGIGRGKEVESLRLVVEGVGAVWVMIKKLFGGGDGKVWLCVGPAV